MKQMLMYRCKKKRTKDQKKYEQLLKKADTIRQKVKKFKILFAQKINALPKVDDKYQGEVNQFGAYEGIGLYKYVNGEVHRGEWKNGKRHGIGFYTFKNGSTYEGEYQFGKASGIGIEHLEGGNSMVAEYQNNKSNGLGVYYTANGQRLQGNFVDNIFQGQTCLIFPDGTWVSQYYKDGNVVDFPSEQGPHQ